jgi:hypothetical protein
VHSANWGVLKKVRIYPEKVGLNQGEFVFLLYWILLPKKKGTVPNDNLPLDSPYKYTLS